MLEERRNVQKRSTENIQKIVHIRVSRHIMKPIKENCITFLPHYLFACQCSERLQYKNLKGNFWNALNTSWITH
uniref:Heat shock protein binding protein n=1 Tax=Rhizophora mucronata TaxID=61149 RepID=A0A2P2LZ44_RHIMU